MQCTRVGHQQGCRQRRHAQSTSMQGCPWSMLASYPGHFCRGSGRKKCNEQFCDALCLRYGWNLSNIPCIFDDRVFYPNAPSNRSMTATVVYRKHKSIKKTEYAQRVCEVEHGVFTPFVLSTSAAKLQYSIRDWQMEFLARKERNIQSSLGGFGVVSPSRSSALPPCAFMEADPLITAQSTS